MHIRACYCVSLTAITADLFSCLSAARVKRTVNNKHDQTVLNNTHSAMCFYSQSYYELFPPLYTKIILYILSRIIFFFCNICKNNVNFNNPISFNINNQYIGVYNTIIYCRSTVKYIHLVS